MKIICNWKVQSVSTYLNNAQHVLGFQINISLTTIYSCNSRLYSLLYGYVLSCLSHNNLIEWTIKSKFNVGLIMPYNGLIFQEYNVNNQYMFDIKIYKIWQCL